MTGAEEIARKKLFQLQDADYRTFRCKLIPTVDPETVIGVRMPALRKFAKEFGKTPEAAEFLQCLPHRYYEENNLHGLLIENMRDYGQTVASLDAFLPHVDNWATCDLMRPRAFRRHLPELLEQIKAWLASNDTYTVRFAIGMMMTFYLDEAFRPEYPAMVAEVHSGEYYVNMMIAWYFATALAKQYDAALPYLLQRRLDPWTHNRTIQKALEGYRVTDAQKAHLRSLKLPKTGAEKPRL